MIAICSNEKVREKLKRNGRNWLDFGRLPVELKRNFVTRKDPPGNIFPSGEVK